MTQFKSGFVNIIGRPNVGKSTLTNAITGNALAIVTHKPQTTRHRILSIKTTDSYQIVFSDTPGIIDDPNYALHKSLNSSAFSAFDDADILIVMTDDRDPLTENESLIFKLKQIDAPVILLINKIDRMTSDQIQLIRTHWEDKFTFNAIFMISAINSSTTEPLLDYIITQLPIGEPYFPSEDLSDRHERFFVTEIIREQILLLYRQEIPYACEVAIEWFEELDHLTKISAIIYVSRPTQKGILIGNKGEAIKELGIQSRKKIEKFLNTKVYLELHVKIKKDWRDDERSLKYFGYV